MRGSVILLGDRQILARKYVHLGATAEPNASKEVRGNFRATLAVVQMYLKSVLLTKEMTGVREIAGTAATQTVNTSTNIV